MRITREQLNKIIKEELEQMMCFQLKEKLRQAEEDGDEEKTKEIKAEMKRKDCSPFG